MLCFGKTVRPHFLEKSPPPLIRARSVRPLARKPGPRPLAPTSPSEHTHGHAWCSDRGKHASKAGAIDLSQWRSTNTTGYKGVKQNHSGRYEARIWVSGEAPGEAGHQRSLGIFDSAQEAARVYAKAYIDMHGPAPTQAQAEAAEDEDEPRSSMSDGAKALIDSLLVFSEDGMDDVANHIEANRSEDQLAEEEIENFIGSMTDHAMSSFAERLELGFDEGAADDGETCTF